MFVGHKSQDEVVICVFNVTQCNVLHFYLKDLLSKTMI